MKFKPFFKIEKLLKECTEKKKSSESNDSVLNNKKKDKRPYKSSKNFINKYNNFIE